jgi:hypothetical protein
MNIKSVEGWYVIFQILSVLFVMLTVGTGAGTIITGYIANRRQTKAIADANTKSADARAEVAKLQVSVAEAERKRAEAERALLELQERLKARTITPEQRTAFLRVLENAPKGSVEISVVTDDREAFGFASQIRDILQAAGYDVGLMGSFTIFGQPLIGVRLNVKSAEKQPPHGGPIQQALEAAGVQHVVATLGGEKDDVVYIAVGTKP